MAKERPLDLTVARTWIAAWKEKDLYSDAAVHHLHSLIPNNNCMVVITFGIGRAPRSLVFSCCRFVAVAPQSGMRFFARTVVAECDINNIFASSVAPMAPSDGQLWRQTDTSPQKVLQWEGTRWVHYGYFREVTIISKQGEQECGFMEALASAHRLARWNGCEVIFTFDDSTWGNA
jgi:hypothetical protein